MWLYSQSTGFLWDNRKLKIAVGYSGFEEGKNNPKLEAVRNVGTIPRGRYIIGEPYDSERVGPFALPLIPNGHNAHGRTDFLFHGDSRSHPGKASKGCIVLPRNIRQLIHSSNDKILDVIE